MDHKSGRTLTISSGGNTLYNTSAKRPKAPEPHNIHAQNSRKIRWNLGIYTRRTVFFPGVYLAANERAWVCFFMSMMESQRILGIHSGIPSRSPNEGYTVSHFILHDTPPILLCIPEQFLSEYR